MMEELKELAKKLWEEHRMTTCGLLLGLIVGASILIFGFWNTLFVILCGGVGLNIGMKLDKGESFDALVDRLRLRKN